jgi:hypothetical protein
MTEIKKSVAIHTTPQGEKSMSLHDCRRDACDALMKRVRHKEVVAFGKMMRDYVEGSSLKFIAGVSGEWFEAFDALVQTSGSS